MKLSVWNQENYDVKVEFTYQFDAEKGFRGEGLKPCWNTLEDGISLLQVGLGKKEECTRLQVKEACAKAIKEVRSMHLAICRISLEPFVQLFGDSIVYDVTEGLVLGGFQAENFKTDQTVETMDIYVVNETTLSAQVLQEKLTEAYHVAESILFARNLVNCPGNYLTPVKMAQAVQKACEGLPIEIEVLDEKEAKALHMESFLAVGMSSGNMPRLIVLRYKGDAESKEISGYIGKGITMDTGGYCLKPSASMVGMKGDMAGAAAVAGAVIALAKNRVKKNVTAVIPACENRISREAYLPGDVLTSMSGKTVEVLNTDAEGRLILIDAITYAIQKEHVTELTDIATLTGAVVAMFGFTAAGVQCSDDRFYQRFEAAAQAAGERYWRLPVYPEYRKLLDSTVADIQNISSDGCGTITAGLFIKEFTEGLPWIHMDIAGTAWVSSPKFAFQENGGTGSGVSTLYFMAAEQK